jgi:acyl carrier protein phosphodiesterase
MNYLAHLFLADNDPESIVGNLMGDFIKGHVDQKLPAKLRNGILLHRKIDVYTDSHPVFKQSKQRISPDFRRYAGILIDLYYDHFLAQQWNTYSATPLPVFSESVYKILENHFDDLPDRMQRSVLYMIKHNLLLSYYELEGIDRALRGIESRLKRPSNLAAALTELQDNYTDLNIDFSLFFPELISYVKNYKENILTY